MTSFEYRVQARNPGTYLAFGACGLLACAAWTLEAPAIAWVPVLALLSAILWRLAVNPRTGFRLTEDRLEIFAPGEFRVVPLAHIDSVALTRDDKGAPGCMILTRDGRRIALPCASRFQPADLRRQFTLRDVRILI